MFTGLHSHLTISKAFQLYQIARVGVNILVSIILVRAISDLGLVGQHEQLWFLVGICSFFWTSGMTKAVYTFSGSGDKPPYTVAFCLLAVIGVISGFVLYWGKAYWAQLFGIVEFDFWGKTALLLALSMPLAIVETIYINQSRTKSLLTYGAIVYSSQLIGAVYFLYGLKSVDSFITFLLIWALLRALWMVREIISVWHWSVPMLLPFLAYSFPLVLHMLVGNGMEYVDSFLVNRYYDTSVFPVFRYGARELPFATVLTSALAFSLLRNFRSSMEQGLLTTKQELHSLIRWLFPLSGALMWCSPLLYMWFYGEAFVLSAILFNIYLLIVLTRVWLPQVIIQASHDNKVLVYSALVELIVNVVLSLVLLQFLGLIGLAIATWVAYLINKVILMMYVYYKYGIALREYLPLKHYITWSVAVIGSFVTSFYWFRSVL